MRRPLVRALAGVGMDATDVATRLGVDPKTVERWFAGRAPYPRHRAALAELTGWAVTDLWPEVARRSRRDPCDESSDEVLVSYPRRSAVPAETWRRLFDSARQEIGILAYSGLFLAEDAAIQRVLRDKAQHGARVRIALGDPGGRHVVRRGTDEGIDDIMAARIRNALVLYRSLADEPSVEMRLHDTTLYNSIYRIDGEILVNTHLYGCLASHAPVLHLRRRHDDGMAATYFDSFERVWASARAVSTGA